MSVSEWKWVLLFYRERKKQRRGEAPFTPGVGKSFLDYIAVKGFVVRGGENVRRRGIVGEGTRRSLRGPNTPHFLRPHPVSGEFVVHDRQKKGGNGASGQREKVPFHLTNRLAWLLLRCGQRERGAGDRRGPATALRPEGKGRPP